MYSFPVIPSPWWPRWSDQVGDFTLNFHKLAFTCDWLIVCFCEGYYSASCDTLGSMNIVLCKLLDGYEYW